MQARPQKAQQPSLRWQREQQQLAAAQKPIPIPYPHKKALEIPTKEATATPELNV